MKQFNESMYFGILKMDVPTVEGLIDLIQDAFKQYNDVLRLRISVDLGKMVIEEEDLNSLFAHKEIPNKIHKFTICAYSKGWENKLKILFNSSNGLNFISVTSDNNAQVIGLTQSIGAFINQKSLKYPWLKDWSLKLAWFLSFCILIGIMVISFQNSFYGMYKEQYIYWVVTLFMLQYFLFRVSKIPMFTLTLQEEPEPFYIKHQVMIGILLAIITIIIGLISLIVQMNPIGKPISV